MSSATIFAAGLVTGMVGMALLYNQFSVSLIAPLVLWAGWAFVIGTFVALGFLATVSAFERFI